MQTLTVSVGGDTATQAYVVPPLPVLTLASIQKSGDLSIADSAQHPTSDFILQLPAGTFELIDFKYGFVAASFQGYGFYATHCKGIIGAGTDVTIIRMKANSAGTTSTTAPSGVNSIVMPGSGQTNNYQVIRIGQGTSGVTNGYVTDLTIQATPQANMPYYNGLYLWYNTNAYIARVRVVGMPGFASSPPGETFLFNDNHSTGTYMEDCEADGRDPVTGTPVGSAGFGTNSCSNVTRVRCYSHHSGFGAGFTSYQNSNFTFINCRSEYNAKSGYNFEVMSGTVVMTGCSATGNTGAPIIADSNVSSTKFSIANFIYNLGAILTVLIHTKYNYPPPDVSPNAQLPSPNTTPPFSGPSDFVVTEQGVPGPVNFVTNF